MSFEACAQNTTNVYECEQNSSLVKCEQNKHLHSSIMFKQRLSPDVAPFASEKGRSKLARERALAPGM